MGFDSGEQDCGVGGSIDSGDLGMEGYWVVVGDIGGGEEVPGRVPGYSRSDLKLLPSSTSKKGIWKVYRTAAENSNVRCVAYTTFCKIWRNHLPQVLLMKHLCWQCQQNSTAIFRTANCPEGEMSEAVKSAEEHLRV